METLADLITRQLHARGETVTAFADRIGSNRQTIRGWQTSLPAPAMLNRVATALDLPYPTVLTAALRSAEYIEDLADILAGQTVHAVARCNGSPYDRGDFAPEAIFTDPDRASEFTEIANAVTDDADFELAPLVIDAAEPPPAVRIYTMEWSNRTDRIAETSVLVGDIPTRLENRVVGEINGIELADTGEIYRLRVDSLDPESGRAALQTVVEQLRSEGRLLSPEIDTRDGRFSGMTEWAYEQSLLAGIPAFDTSLLAEGWNSAADALAAAGLPLQTSPLADRLAEHVRTTPYIWGGGQPPVPPQASRPERRDAAYLGSGGDLTAGTPIRRTPIALSEIQPGDIGFVAGRTVMVVGPGEIIGLSGQRQPISDIVQSDFAGFFRMTPDDIPPRSTNPGSRRRRVVIEPPQP
ncbi:XRE family transcriptional regulator [Mycolicibacterium goodii]|uniref:XRE family transcriptional regulator n=1 Tax=Mycolicibacterium goodii TaxID=134601 RepID=UPI001BDC6BA9|nr:XRE family transcriptional regulator [Mycolicibacterium goodii]MBU8840229.1 XRE family transcriptional regulator [Mycolicibacterium goodii]